MDFPLISLLPMMHVLIPYKTWYFLNSWEVWAHCRISGFLYTFRSTQFWSEKPVTKRLVNFFPLYTRFSIDISIVYWFYQLLNFVDFHDITDKKITCIAILHAICSSKRVLNDYGFVTGPFSFLTWYKYTTQIFLRVGSLSKPTLSDTILSPNLDEGPCIIFIIIETVKRWTSFEIHSKLWNYVSNFVDLHYMQNYSASGANFRFSPYSLR